MKDKIRRFEDLIAWQKARALASTIYRTARERPFSRDFPLRNQICSAAGSVPSNIAEGFERNRLTEFHQFLSIAKASCAEVRSQLYVAFDVGYIDDRRLDSLLRQAEEVGRVIGGLRKSVANKALRTQHSALRTRKCSSKT
ncbi:MAG TPA: four helix bundle protein [Thermoanaerobaculia bacterium]|jgi:four helix bundle protein